MILTQSVMTSREEPTVQDVYLTLCCVKKRHSECSGVGATEGSGYFCLFHDD